jgi:hypothetical protein
VFVLIGDVRDTLRDRSIIVRMVRADAPQRLVYAVAEGEGSDLQGKLHEAVTGQRRAILDIYGDASLRLTWLPDRDEEIWLPLFAIATVFCPERLPELIRISTDLATEKTLPAARLSDESRKEAEEEANEKEYAVHLLRDVATVIGSHRYVWTVDLLTALYELPTGPWRKYKGAPLAPATLGLMLQRFGLSPKTVRSSGGRQGSTTKKGYTLTDVRAAMAQHSITDSE